MKKKYVILLITMFLIPFKVCAAGGFNVSSSNVSMYPGESKTINISSYNSVGRLNISSSNGAVASVNMGSVFIQTPGSSQSITITANSIGTAIISVVASSDYATMDEEILAGQVKTITVNVVARQTQNPTPTPTPSQNNNNNNTNNNLSTNNKLKSISVKGYELIKKDNNNYTLTVNNNTTSIDIIAASEDPKATVSGTGQHKLLVGDNNIEVIITSESGTKNKINIKVTRKDGYYLEDLNSVLEDSKIKEASIIINAESKISKNDIESIKKSGKIVTLNYYDKNKVLVYSWILDGSKIKDSKEFLTTISYISNYSKKISIQANYAEGISVSFKHSGELPKGTKIKLYVGDKFTDDSIINIYYYNQDKEVLKNIKKGIKVQEGYVEFELEHCSDYFITMSNVINTIKETNFSIDIFMIISIIEFIIIITLILIYCFKIKPNIKREISIDDLIIDAPSNMDEQNKNY